jgi:hypothetical protein
VEVSLRPEGPEPAPTALTPPAISTWPESLPLGNRVIDSPVRGELNVPGTTVKEPPDGLNSSQVSSDLPFSDPLLTASTPPQTRICPASVVLTIENFSGLHRFDKKALVVAADEHDFSTTIWNGNRNVRLARRSHQFRQGGEGLGSVIVDLGSVDGFLRGAIDSAGGGNVEVSAVAARHQHVSV